jgi:hypothetical protein
MEWECFLSQLDYNICRFFLNNTNVWPMHGRRHEQYMHLCMFSASHGFSPALQTCDVTLLPDTNLEPFDVSVV